MTSPTAVIRTVGTGAGAVVPADPVVGSGPAEEGAEDGEAEGDGEVLAAGAALPSRSSGSPVDAGEQADAARTTRTDAQAHRVLAGRSPMTGGR